MKSRLGFTIIEVSLFLAISGLLFAGIAAGSSLNVAKQRYNTAVDDYTEFLRRLYASTKDVQNEHDKRGERRLCTVRSGTGSDVNAQEKVGRTECAIYGRIAVFNAETDNNDTSEHNDKIMVYDVIGDVIDHESDRTILKDVTDTLSALAAVHAEFLAFEKDGSVTYAGNATSYTPEWSSHIENENEGEYWSGAVMIVRSPIDGSVHTYVLDLNNSSFRIYDPIDDAKGLTVITTTKDLGSSYLANYLTPSSSSDPRFKETVANFCVNSDDSYAYNGRRRNVRIKADGANSSAVELIGFDSGEYDAKTNPGGSACE